MNKANQIKKQKQIFLRSRRNHHFEAVKGKYRKASKEIGLPIDAVRN